jgi:two-component system sensor histidine kinase KdpD
MPAGAAGSGRDRGNGSHDIAGDKVRTAALAATSAPAAAHAAEMTGRVEAAGRFCVYLGVAVGAGKTLAMLEEGQRRRQRGADVVIGFVECHGRPVTGARMAGLATVPRRVVEYRGTRFEEMDLDGVLARRPEVALVDELAHTNLPGSGRHGKRWQDVLELLDAGISVITTVNVQHLESLADGVERITGVRVRERVPDWVVRRADQIELVDSSPEQLRRRMLHGDIYPAEQVPQALAHFFRAGNLAVLRQLALWFLAGETGEGLLEHLARYQSGIPRETTERIMASVTPAPGAQAIVRRASQLAAKTKAELHIVHITSDAATQRSSNDCLAGLRQVVADAGASWHELDADDPAAALIEFARGHQITQIVISSSRCSRWAELIGAGSTVKRVSRLAVRAGIDVHILARREESVP